MQEPDWDCIQEIYHEALKLHPSERSAFVEKAADNDTILGREVIELLNVAGSLGGFMDTPIVELPLTSAADGLLGTTINGRYSIERKLGHGGMGQVYLARDLRVNGRAVVIKFLLRELAADSYAVQKFKQEAEALSRIRNTGIVEVLDTGELADGLPYFVMQYIDGETLRSQIPNEGMRLERVASIIQQVGAALEHVHEQKVLHRDLKPENIMFRRGTDSVVVVDFGIAKVKDSVIASTTTNGVSAGTLMYMSPEQLRDEETTAASDIYSMAVVAYEMVTGRRPFKATSRSQLLERQQAGVELKPITLRRSLSRKAQEILLRGLSFKPSARYQNAKQFGDSLAQALLESHVPKKNKRWLKIFMIVLGVALASYGVYKVLNGTSKPPPPNRSFTYYLTVQRTRDGQPYKEAIKSHGEETYGTGDQFQLTVSTPVPAYLYIFHEPQPKPDDDTSFKMIYPRRTTNNGSASLGADQSVQSNWFTFEGPAGAENFWFVWSTSPVAELDSASSEAFKHDGGLTGQTLVAVREYLKTKEAEIKAITYNYNANKNAVVRGKHDLLVTLAQFKHR